MATEAQINAIVGLYVAYFDRAPDPVGLQFWIDQLDNGRDFTTISQDFANSSEAQSIYPYLSDDNDLGTISPVAFITNIYANLFGRVPDQEGLEFWTEVLESGAVAPGDMVEAISLGARDDPDDTGFFDRTVLDNKIECARYFTEQASQIPTFPMGEAGEWLPGSPEYLAAVGAIGAAGDNDASIDQCKEYIDNVLRDFIPNSTFTLCENVLTVTTDDIPGELVTKKVLYWGYNPHSHDETDGVDNFDGNNPDGNDNNLTNEGPEDGGIPVDAFFGSGGYLYTLISNAGVEDFLDDGIDVDDDEGLWDLDLSNVRDITLTANGGENGSGGVITFEYADGSADDIALGEAYFALISSLILDEEGNTRFFEKEVAAQVPVWLYSDGQVRLDAFETMDEDGNAIFAVNGDGSVPGQGEDLEPVGYIDAVLPDTPGTTTTTYIPIVLTPNENNGGTKEAGFTSDDDDLIQVGRLELLHGAVIDGGGGYNTLEVDAKGHFAQAKALQNIQHISIQNLPNIYTDDSLGEDNDGELNVFGENLYPNLSLDGAYDNDSIIDISRATDLETLTLTQGDFEDIYSDDDGVEEDPGDLTVTGIRNGAVATIDGHWTEGDLRLNYSGVQGDGVHVIFNNLHMDDSSDLEIGHNATKLTIESTGGGNYVYEGNLAGDDAYDGGINHLVITGDAHLHIDSDMDGTFNDDTPITVDASANTAGVDLHFTYSEKVTFIGSQANDRLSLSLEDNGSGVSSGTDQGPSFDDDQEVVIEGGVGDNYYNIETDDKLTITNADGNNNYEIDANVAVITAGNGHNFLQGDAAHLTTTFGDGNNRIEVELVDSNSSENIGIDDVETGADIVLGDGANKVTLTVGDDLDQLGGTSSGAQFQNGIDLPEINITAGDGGNTILIPGLPVGTPAEGLPGVSGSSSYKALSQVTINTGDGDDTMVVAAANLTINSNGGDDTITILGVDDDYVTEVYSYESADPDLAENASAIEITPNTAPPSGFVLSNLGFENTFISSPVTWEATYQLDGSSETISVTGLNSNSSDADILNALAAELNGQSGISASVDLAAGTVTVLPDDGSEPLVFVGTTATRLAIGPDPDAFAGTPVVTSVSTDSATIFLRIDGAIEVIEVDLTGVDSTNETALLNEIASVLDADGRIDAEVIAGKVAVTGESGSVVSVEQVDFDGPTNGVGATVAQGVYTVTGYGSDGLDGTGYNYKGFIPSVYGVEFNIDTGTGAATVNLGAFNDNLAEVTGAMVAMEGSSIIGQDITLVVNTDADLRAASLTGITAVIMDDDNRLYSGQGFPSGSNDPSKAASLTLLDSQLVQLMSEGVDFSTQGQTFGAQSVLTIVITEDTKLSELIDLPNWNDSIKLCFVVSDGATLTLSAEELHEYVAPDGIAVDEENGYIDNQVVVTNAGFNFDPFGQQNGGSGGGTIAGSLDNQDVDIIYVPGGYERPGQDPSTATITINSDDTPSVEDIVSPFANDLVIVGSADLEITGRVDLADDFTIDFSNFGGNFAENADGAQVAMTIYNFQEITGDVNDLFTHPNDGDTNISEVPTNPYSWGRIDGNGTSDDPVRINIVMQPDTIVGDCDWGVAKGGFNSSGVQQYVLTGFIDENDYIVPQSSSSVADIVVCDHTEDLEVLGLQNNRNASVTFHQVNWGTEILMEGDGYANASDQEKNLGDPDLSEVGHVTANFFEPGANAYVRITNQGTLLGENEDAEDGYDPLGERKLVAGSIVVNNADRLRIDVEDGDAIIKDVTGIDVERVIVNGVEDVELRIDCIAEVDGTGSLKNDTIGQKGDGFDSRDLKSIDGTGVAGEFKLTFDGDGTTDDTTDVDPWGVTIPGWKIVDLSKVALTGVDAIELAGDNIKLIMTADQLVAFGDIISTTGDNSTLDVVDLSDQALDLTTLDVDNIGCVFLAEGEYTIDPATDFGDAGALVMVADGDDITATMTLDQLQTVSGAGDETLGDPSMTVNVSKPNICFDEDNGGDAKLILTGVEGDDQIFLGTNVLAGPNGGQLEVEITGSDFVGTDKFAILPDDMANNSSSDPVFIHVILDGGVNDVTEVPAEQLLGLDCLTLKGGAVLDITAAQLAVLMSKTPQEIKVADGETATINIVDLYDDVLSDTGTTKFDLNALVEANPGLDIGTISIRDTDTGEVEDFTGTTGTPAMPLFTFGGADEIITPTGGASSPEFGVESTQIIITANQFLDLDGIGFISGGSVVNIEDLANTIDGGDNGADPDSLGVDKPDTDTVEIDTSGITARKGTLKLIEVGTTTSANGEAVFLTDSSDISGFEIILTDGQLIGFATEAQASGAIVTESLSTAITMNSNPTGIVWCFETWSGNPIDTSNYDPNINTLFVYDTLVDGQNEEAIWTYLPGSIDVQKFNDAIPIGLAVINRVNIFEPFTTAPNGITFNDEDGQQTIGRLTLILEGNVLLGDVTIDDTVGDGDFEGIIINSTFDNENNPGDSNVIIQENEVGNINLNAPMAANTVLEVLLNASDDQPDASFANGTTGAGSGTDTDFGNDLVTGTISLGTPAAGVNAAVIDVNNSDGTTAGADITIGGIDYSNAFLTRVDVETDGFGFATGDLTIGTLNVGDLSTAMGLGGSANKYLILNNFTATSTTDLNDTLATGFSTGATVTTGSTIIMATDGDVDLKAMGSGAGVFDVDGVYATSAGTLSLTGAQLAAIGIIDTVGGADGIADNWVLGPGVNPGDVTINICDLDTTTAVNLDAIAAAGFNIGTITITEDQVVNGGTTLGGADEIVIELGNSGDTTVALEMTAAQFKGFSGIISETTIPSPFNPTATYKGQVIVDELEGVEEGTDLLTVDINFGQVTTTGDNTTMLSSNTGTVVVSGPATPFASPTAVSGGNGDVILTDTSVLGNFQVRLNDVDSVGGPNELAGHTIRFSTTEQAGGRVVIVDGPDGTEAEQDTNVVWLFKTLGADGNPGLDVRGYDENLGRVWVYDDLVETMDENNIELLFTIPNPDEDSPQFGEPLFTLKEGIIKRIESTDLTEALSVAQPYAQTIEIVSGTGLDDLMATITDPVIFLEQLTIDLGGLTDNGNLEIDNLIGIDVLGDDDFKELTLNSFIGDFYTNASTKHYLLPDDFSIPPDALPSDALQFPNPANVFGDIRAGDQPGDRGVLRDITINTGAGEYLLTVSADGDGIAHGNEEVSIDWTLNGTAQTAFVVSLSNSIDATSNASDIAAAINALPSTFGISAQANGATVVVNDNGSDTFAFTSGTTGGTIGAFTITPSDPTGERGTALEAQTIFFSEDDTPEVGKAGAAGVADLEINGVHDVTVKGIDTTDAEIIVHNMDVTGHTGTFTATGGSAAWTGGSSTEKLIIDNGSGSVGEVLFGGQSGDNPATAFTQETDFFVPTEVGGQVQAGIDGEALSKIDTSTHGGTVNLGVVSRIDGTGMNADTTPGFDPAETFNGGFNDGFILDNGGVGTVILCLGSAETTDDGVQTPTLEAGGEWTFSGPGIELEMKQVVLEGTLNLIGVELCITDEVSFADLEALNVSGGTTIEVKAGGKLTLTVEQADDLEAITFFGEGEICVTGESDSSDGDINTTFGHLRTATVNFSDVTLDAGDSTLEITANGAAGNSFGSSLFVNGDRVAQTIVGSDDDINEEVTVTLAASDFDDTTIDVITRLKGDNGDINTENDTPTSNTPEDTGEVQGDVITNLSSADVQVEVDEGFDTLEGMKTGDVVQVATGAQFYGQLSSGHIDFVASSDTSNGGTAVIEATLTDQTIDVSDAGGAEGWSLIGAEDGTMNSLYGFTFVPDTAFEGNEEFIVDITLSDGSGFGFFALPGSVDVSSAAAAAPSIAATLDALYPDLNVFESGGVITLSTNTGATVADVSIFPVSGTIDTFAAVAAMPDPSVLSGNTLIGSDNDDNNTIVDGKAAGPDNEGQADSHTGNDGMDRFLFNVLASDVAAFTVSEDEPALDVESASVGYADTDNNDATGTADDPTDEIRVNVQIGAGTRDILINKTTAPTVDFTSSSSIAAAMASVLNAEPDITAYVDSGTNTLVYAYGEDGMRFAFNSFTATGPGMDAIGGSITTDPETDGDYSNDGADVDDDDNGQIRITLDDSTNPVSPGESYKLTVVLGNGTPVTKSVTVDGTVISTTQDVIDALAALFEADIGGGGSGDVIVETVNLNAGSVTPAAAAEQIVFRDVDANDGGVTADLTKSGGTETISGLSSSSIVSSTGTLADQDADRIEDFLSGVDKIDFDSDILVAGSNANYSDDGGTAAATYAAGYTAADTAMNGTVLYYMTSIVGGNGVLFYDANADGDPDGVIELVGLNSSSFDEDDII